MKTKDFLVPDSTIISFFSSVSQTDKGLVRISIIEEELECTLEGYKLINDVCPIFSIVVKINRANDNMYGRMDYIPADI